jgi:DNA polymerase
MCLPSGRLLAYCDPEINDVKTPWGDTRSVVTVMQLRGTWRRKPMTPGQWCENAVQAASRDLLVAGILAAEREGFACVLSVHDELIAEEPIDDSGARLDLFLRCMETVPPWATGCPVKASGWRGRRYRKE